MASWRESNCPICRHEYNHFPSICELLHFLLLKMYPITFKIREKQLLEEEKKRDCFSPQLELSNSCVNSSVNTNPIDAANSQNFVENTVVTNSVYVEENTYLNHKACKAVSINDVLCITCKKMLFQPVVLNCGHAYCESCLAVPEDEALHCQLCQTPHPNGFPKVCLVLDNFLETEFPQEYVQRREDVQHKIVHCQQGIASSGCTTSSKKEAPVSSTKPSQYYSAAIDGIGPDVHFAAGCDYCGIYPIIGERYRCKDCVESIGFDLCGPCYNTGSKRPGRFNQQHTEGHSFELVTPRRFGGIPLTLIPVIFEADFASSDTLDEAPEDDSDEAPENESGYLDEDLLDGAPEDSEISDSTI
ncbi:hypothetical protein MKW94_030550 [Papaver nudicaule]|uniref:E3 ubiquitin-protein ligase PRT1 n=1 Tax=Papaver nudicaule TaxID=74823 RepID=A0AA41RRN9_PAPNU|nr:hypothetical protein [Papaver nudicaule]